MNEAKTTLKRLAVYGLLLLINVLFCANFIPDVFPLRNFSTVYLLILSVCLVFYYSYRLAPSGILPAMMKVLSLLCLLLILLRGVKYSAVPEVEVLARHTWYLYYLPTLLIPLFLFYVAILVSYKNRARATALLACLTAVTAGLLTMVLTNDLHRMVFGFRAGFENWNTDYTRGWLFYVVNLWHYGLLLAAIIILVIKCRVVSSKKSAWVILIPFVTGAAMSFLLLTGSMPRINGAYIIEFPEALIFTVAAVLECCIQLGLIPSNTDYGRLFRHFSISAQITDEKGGPVYLSYTAVPLTKEQFETDSGSRIGEHTVLNKMKLPGGYGFWLDDMTEIDRLNDEVAEAKEGLAQEVELIRLRSELKENRTKTVQRTLVYDNIARRTQKQSGLIRQLAGSARSSNDNNLKRDSQRQIMLLGAYIKRYANLTLLAGESDVIGAGELGISISEVLRHLNRCGIPGEIIINSDAPVRAEAAIAAFEAFERIIELNFPRFKGVFANISSKGGVTLKLTAEDLTEDLPEDVLNMLSEAGAETDVKKEDNVTFICFTLPEGGVTNDPV